MDLAPDPYQIAASRETEARRLADAGNSVAAIAAFEEAAKAFDAAREAAKVASAREIEGLKKAALEKRGAALAVGAGKAPTPEIGAHMSAAETALGKAQLARDSAEAAACYKGAADEFKKALDLVQSFRLNEAHAALSAVDGPRRKALDAKADTLAADAWKTAEAKRQSAEEASARGDFAAAKAAAQDATAAYGQALEKAQAAALVKVAASPAEKAAIDSRAEMERSKAVCANMPHPAEPYFKWAKDAEGRALRALEAKDFAKAKELFEKAKKFFDSAVRGG